MPIISHEVQALRRCTTPYIPLIFRNWNRLVLVPYRLAMWCVHFSTLICVTRGSDRMIRVSSLARGYAEEDYVFLRQVTNLCLATSFLCLFFNLWGVLTSRTLRFGVDNWFQGSCHGAAAVLLIVSWQATAHVARIWQMFCIFSIIPTGIEAITLAHSYWRGMEFFW
ncbi:conserved hypothetical protein [Leishmania major strain Friedlin]|uniref:Uncharacterized protein n=1 Tax=Leishmania major TaxID=5664 RepID=Q4Q7I5_LEIMA|nr:conserved hypothetical protein [Leishmania major strain Friedlin]CAG9578314.1 Transmembrane_protein_-_putative [Leishmania major strain Friedlin]CAJ06163.1 conserved hypothetical protein [Leishmania major strain Friedlin]|eukprot:XP_001684713.1 conserved hypothetical protein [Leishmania major strain Friedlin]